MTKTATKAAPAPAENAAIPAAPSSTEVAAPKSVVTNMGAPPPRPTAPKPEEPHPLDKLGSGATLEEVAAALGIDTAGTSDQAAAGQGAELETEDLAEVETEQPAQTEAPAGQVAEWDDPLVKERPAYIPAKFKNLEAFAKSYAFLEKKQGQQAAQPKSGPMKIEKPAEAKPGEAQAFKLDQQSMMELAVEWDAEGGKLKEETYAKLEKSGIAREAADEYGRLKSAERDRMVDGALQKQGLDRAGAQELLAWAGKSLPAEEISAINGLLETPNPVMWEIAFQRLKTAHSVATRATRPRLAGGSNAASGVQPLTTQEQVSQAVSDKRYGNDPAYTEEVNRRIELGLQVST